MGLGAPKRRNKLSHDPNNTAWSRSTDNFGHRMLAQQGWQPGQYLGAENANHSDHYTAANASHIRVLLREDNLGLGAKVGGNKAETFGLSLFSGVLGRLNGKSDGQVQKQQDALRDAELRQYQVGKYGFMNFVSGGLLVGDKIEKPSEKDAIKYEQPEGSVSSQGKVGKKRKAEDDAEAEGQSTKVKKSRIRGTSEHGDVGSVEPAQLDSDDRSRKESKKSKRKAGDARGDDPVQSATTAKKSKKRRQATDDEDSTAPKISKDEKARLKQEKRARKEDRRRRKEEKRLKRQAKQDVDSEPEAKAVVTSAPAPTLNGGRHAVRHRYIQQKRMAGMDAQAMKEIFMIKAAA